MSHSQFQLGNLLKAFSGLRSLSAFPYDRRKDLGKCLKYCTPSDVRCPPIELCVVMVCKRYDKMKVSFVDIKKRNSFVPLQERLSYYPLDTSRFVRLLVMRGMRKGASGIVTGKAIGFLVPPRLIRSQQEY